MAAKSTTIPSYNKMQKMDKNGAVALLDSLRLSVDQIYNRNASVLRYEELYRNAYTMVLHKHGDILYDGYTDMITGHLRKSVAGIKSLANPDKELLNAVSVVWAEHTTAFKMISDIMMYLDNTYVEKQVKNKLKTYPLALRLFKETVVFHPDIRDNLRQALLTEIHQEREGFVVDRNICKTILGMYADLSIYDEEFEAFFLVETRSYYTIESLTYISTNTCPDYLAKCEARLTEEAARLTHYLAASSEKRLIDVVEHELITVHAGTIVDMESSGLVPMLRDDKMADLRRLWALFSRVPANLARIRDGMGRFLIERGEEIVNSEESQKDPVRFVTLVLELKDKFDGIIGEAFKKEPACEKRLKEAFEEFVNKDSKCASYLAAYVDELLRNGVQGASEDVIEAQLEKVIVVFKYLRDKDVFESYYRNLLSKRLLAGKSGSDDVEKQMIAKLKAECGYQFTNKLEGMFVDIANSRGVMDAYRRTDMFAHAPLELDIHILTTGNWPLQVQPPIQLPPVIMSYTDMFTAFYLEKHSGRKLSWVMSTGTADMKANFPGGRKDLNVSNYQMCILMLFNEHTTLSLEAIRSATSIPEIELRRHLLSLCTPKLKILQKGSKGKGIEDVDDFTFNAEFTSKFKRIKVPLISLKEVQPTDAGAGDLPSGVEEERRHLVEAAVVRTMKTRKTMSHNDLIAEVVRQLSMRFVPNPQFIKKRIESLIEREFLQRHADDARLYNYLA